MIGAILATCRALALGVLGLADEPPAAQLLFTIGVHVEPLGVTAQGYRAGRGDYTEPRLFQRHVEYLYGLAEVVERHGGRLVIQVQSP